MEGIVEVSDAVLRMPFWFLVDLMLSSRMSGLYQKMTQYTKSIKLLCPDCTFQMDEARMLIIFIAGCFLCFVAVSFYSVAVLFLYAAIFGFGLICMNSLIYSLMLRTAFSPWDRLAVRTLMQAHLGSSFLISLSVLVVLVIMAFPRWPSMKHGILFLLLSLSLTLLSHLPVWFLLNTAQLTYDCHAPPNKFASFHCTTPAWYAYVVALLGSKPCTSVYLSSDLCPFIDFRYALSSGNRICPAISSVSCPHNYCDPKLRQLVYTISSYLLPILNVVLYSTLVRVTSMCKRILSCIHQEIELYRMVGPFEFISFHWNRLNVPLTLALLWCFKWCLVISMGPDQWPITPVSPSGNLSSSNISLLEDYVRPSDNESTLSVLLTRAYVGALVHGSETWLVVFGAAAFFGAVAVCVVRFLILLLDPSGEEITRLFAAAGDAPLNLHEWNVIEDPVLAVDHNDVIAVEMLVGTGWNCAVVFLFLAFQYDLPSLPLTQRICCSVYGLIVIGITCIHPFQALIKSFLLRLGVPGRGSPWISHLRPLFFCFLLMGASLCIIAYVPEGLAERVHDRLVNNSVVEAAADSSASVLVPRFGSSVESLRARQLRITLCGCQLLLALTVTLLEYSVYQYSHRHPAWQGLRSSLFWIKLISSVLDYMISLLSFLTVCWLSVYDSIGLCRLFIICCYFYFILYPSAVRAYTWVRWRILARERMRNLISPSEAELEANGDTCPICYTEMTPASSKFTRCGHLYHIDCLTTWMRRQLFCPICHADLLSTKVTDRRRRDDTHDT
ncbi:unnamed protein product [Dicrocoelium dendriticum]|nr:unnamed protein product [Dicrocoelium dendriticum]